MAGQSALVFGHPSPNRHLSTPSPWFLTATFNSKRVLPVSVRVEPEKDGNAETSSPSSPTSSPAEKPGAAKIAGAGFGAVSSPSKKKGKQKRAPVIRRDPILKPSSPFSGSGSGTGGPVMDQEQQKVNESAFLLTWLGLGLLILIEGIALAASGFLPERFDGLFTKYVYPAFTPTVFLFVGGTVAYGVFKYLQGESQKS